MYAIILAAGMGKRSGMSMPKTLYRFGSKTLIERQISLIRSIGINKICVVVGYKKDLIMEVVNDVVFVYNNIFHITNTAYSLLKALNIMGKDDVVWINGDTFFEKEALEKIVEAKGNVIGMIRKHKCVKEDVKVISKNGKVVKIGKNLVECEGEAIGINKISFKDFDKFVSCLKKCDKNDFFEEGIQKCIDTGAVFKVVDLSGYRCIEMDFPEDFEKLNKIIGND